MVVISNFNENSNTNINDNNESTIIEESTMCHSIVRILHVSTHLILKIILGSTIFPFYR